MSTAKIEFAIGPLSFSGEATEDWLAKQLDKLLKHAKTIPVTAPPAPATQTNGSPLSGPDLSGIASMTLVAFLQKHGGHYKPDEEIPGYCFVDNGKAGEGYFHNKGRNSCSHKGTTAEAWKCFAVYGECAQVRCG